MRTRIKYIRDDKNRPWACIAYQTNKDGTVASFGLSVVNPTKSVQKLTKEIGNRVSRPKSKNPLKHLRYMQIKIVRALNFSLPEKKIVEQEVADTFRKKEGRTLASQRINLNSVTVSNLANPVIDILNLIASGNEINFGKRAKPVNEKIRSMADENRTRMLAKQAERHATKAAKQTN